MKHKHTKSQLRKEALALASYDPKVSATVEEVIRFMESQGYELECVEDLRKKKLKEGA